MPFLIDGHNLIAALPDIDLADPNDEAKLVNKLKGFAARSRKKCIVIFDGGLPGGQSPMSTTGVRVIFAASAHTNADALIKRRIDKMPDARDWMVVSSDNEIQGYARRYRMKTMTAARFSQELQRRAPAQEIPGEEVHPMLSDDEVDEWLGLFGDE